MAVMGPGGYCGSGGKEKGARGGEGIERRD